MLFFFFQSFFLFFEKSGDKGSFNFFFILFERDGDLKRNIILKKERKGTMRERDYVFYFHDVTLFLIFNYVTPILVRPNCIL